MSIHCSQSSPNCKLQNFLSELRSVPCYSESLLILTCLKADFAIQRFSCFIVLSFFFYNFEKNKHVLHTSKVYDILGLKLLKETITKTIETVIAETG